MSAVVVPLARASRLTALSALAACLACSETSSPSSASRDDGRAGASSGERSAELVGQFNVSLNEARADLGTPASTSVSGKVYDGANPVPYLATAIASADACTLYKLVVPFCEGGCPNGVCVGEQACQPYPQAVSVGTVTISGISTTDGKTTMTLLGSQNSYRTSGDTTPAYPGFAEGAAIELFASGGDYAPFEISALGVAPLEVQLHSLALSSSLPIELTWRAATPSVGSTLSVNVNLTHHGGSTGYLECQDLPDTGALTIPAELVSKLIELGVAGYPTMRVTRESKAYPLRSSARVSLVISSEFVRTISVDGFRSCESDAHCSPPESCHVQTKLCR